MCCRQSGVRAAMVLAGVAVILISLTGIAAQDVIASEMMPGIMTTVVLLCLLGTFVHCRSVLRRM